MVFKLLVAMKSRQTVSEHLKNHAHKQGTPTMGGIIVLIGLLAGMAVTWQPGYLPPLVLILGFGLVGFLDDYLMPRWKPGSRGLSWLPKLGLEIGACLVAVFFMGWRDPFLIGIFVFMVLFLSNAYNFSDGLDTLAGGLGMIMAFGFVAIWYLGEIQAFQPNSFVTPAIFESNPLIVAFCLAVSFFPFLVLNAPPAKVFMGDVGALPIGAVFGWLITYLLVPFDSNGTLVGLWPDNILPVVLLLGVMLIEIVPVPLQIASVKIRNKRLFPFKTPIHHAFQDAGWSESRITFLFHVVQIVLVLIAAAVKMPDLKEFIR